MRDNWLSNRVFNSYDNIVDHCCDAWNKLVNQPWRIMSIGSRHWANRFQSTRVGIRQWVAAELGVASQSADQMYELAV